MNAKKTLISSMVLFTILNVSVSEPITHAKTTSENNRVILQNNQRTQINNAINNKYSSVAFVNIGKVTFASSVIIGKNTLLTNKHVLKVLNNDAKQYSFSPGVVENGKTPYGTFKATDYVPISSSEDLVVVHVSPNEQGKSIGDVARIAKISEIEPYIGDKISVVGYPSDKSKGTMWESFGGIQEINGNILKYNASTYGGNSGSPIFNRNNELIGLHYGGVAGSHNQGVIFNDYIKSFINKNIK